jgi:hypothetical protein
MRLARTLSSVVAAAISTAACGGDSAHAAAVTFRCSNPTSGTTWEVKVDYDRSTADSFPAEITGSQIAWHDRRADVRECLEHGRLCYPPYMRCRLTACRQLLHRQRFDGARDDQPLCRRRERRRGDLKQRTSAVI